MCGDSGHGAIYVGGARRLDGVHRVAWLLERGPIPEGLCVLHECDNPPCCNPAHLFLGTLADNTLDMNRKGRRVNPVGVDHGSAKLTEDAVRSIRARYRPHVVTQRALAEEYGVSREAIRHVIQRRVWRHV